MSNLTGLEQLGLVLVIFGSIGVVALAILQFFKLHKYANLFLRIIVSSFVITVIMLGIFSTNFQHTLINLSDTLNILLGV